MLVPLVRTLQTFRPQAQITWIISRPAYDLVEGLDGVEFIVVDKPNGLMDYYRIWKQLKHRSFDVLLAAQASFRANLLIPLIKAHRKIGYDRLRAKDGHHWFIKEAIEAGKDHTLEGFLKFSKPLGIQDVDIRWDIPLPKDAVLWAQQQIEGCQRPLILLNPAASKLERSWSSACYIQLIQYLQTHWGASIILTGGPSDADRHFSEVLTQTVTVYHDLIGKTTPKKLLALIQQADLMICPDTGPSHMSAAMGTPVVALHAVTSAQVSGPYPFRELAVDYYPQAVEKVLGISLQENIWGTHAHGSHTMDLIPLEVVKQKVDGVLQRLMQLDA